MKAFLLVSVALVALTLLVVFLPAARRRARSRIGHRQVLANVYGDQLAELERDVKAGTLDPDAFARSRDEIQRRLLEDSDALGPVRNSAAGRTWWLLVVGAVFVPLAAVGLYAYLGTPQLLVARPERSDPRHEVSMDDISKMIDKLAAHLKEKPDDVVGWSMLGRTYAVLGRFPESVEAYRKALALKPDDAKLLVDYADSLATSRGRKFDDETNGLLARAFKAAPDDPKVLAMLGSSDFQRQDFKAAVDHWKRAVANLPADSEFAQQLQRAIADARQSGGLPTDDAGTPAARAPADATNPSPQGSAQATVKIEGRVVLSQSLAGKASPDDAVFVFARAPEGPRMPLAILKKKVRDLPLEFTLDDTMGMAAGMNISKFPKVVVGARVSKSGQAMPQSGDLEGLTPPVAVGATGLVVEINRAVP